jgi:YgiT-type zinc finger domain-containing protein
MSKKTEGHCPFCGAEEYEVRHTDYLYSHDGDYLLVPNTPVRVCTQCGMIFYEAAVLKEIERRFFAIKQNREKPDHYIQMPSANFA